MRVIKILLATLFSIALASCGGGGGGSATPAAASTYTISGTVPGAASVTITLAGAASKTTTTDASGNYSFTSLANGSYTVTPSLAGHVFTPTSTVVSVGSANVTGKNATATVSTAPIYCLTGSVSGAAVQNVTITLNGANTGSTLTDASGNYSFCGLVSGDYTVTPSLAGYSFTTTSTITIGAANVPVNNITVAVTPSGGSVVFVTVTPLPQATVGVAYTNSVISSISGGSSPYHYQSDSFATGAPPIGMIVDLNGNLTGTPSVAGTYTFGVCAVDLAGASSCKTASITVDPPLNGTWVGTWAWSGTGSNGCSFSDGGSFTMVLTQTGTSFSGTTSATGIQTRNDITCALMSTDVGSGSTSGTISGTTLDLSFDLVDFATLSFTGSATLNDNVNPNTLTASFVRSTGGSGTFTLTRQ